MVHAFPALHAHASLCLHLRMGAERRLKDDAATAEELDLFGRQNEVEVEVKKEAK